MEKDIERMSAMSIYFAADVAKKTAAAPRYDIEGNMSVFSAQQLDALASIMHVKKVPAGCTLFWEGDDAVSVYWLLKGRMKLRKSTSEGKDLLLSIVRPNDLIADIDAWNSAHRYSAEAMEDAEVGVISRLQLELMLCRNGEFAYRFAMWMALIQRQTESKLRDLLLGGKNAALASTLIRLCNSFGVVQKDGILIDLKLTNSELAELAGTTREGVNRMLAVMKKDGTVENCDNGLLRVRSLQRLRQAAGCPECPACPEQICKI